MRKLSSAEVIAPIGAGRRTRGRRQDGKAPEERGGGRGESGQGDETGEGMDGVGIGKIDGLRILGHLLKSVWTRSGSRAEKSDGAGAP